MLDQPQTAFSDFWLGGMPSQPRVRWRAQVATRHGSYEPSFKAAWTHSLHLALKWNGPEREIRPQDSRDLQFCSLLFVNISQIRTSIKILASREVNFPNPKIVITRPVQQSSAYVLSENTSIFRRGPCLVEVHSSFAQKKVLFDAASEVTLSVRSDSHNPLLVAVVAPRFSLFVEEVDSILRQLTRAEWVSNRRERNQRLMNPLAEFRHALAL